MNDEFEKWWAEQLPGLEMCETACKSLARDAWEAGRKDYKGGVYRMLANLPRFVDHIAQTRPRNPGDGQKD